MTQQLVRISTAKSADPRGNAYLGELSRNGIIKQGPSLGNAQKNLIEQALYNFFQASNTPSTIYKSSIYLNIPYSDRYSFFDLYFREKVDGKLAGSKTLEAINLKKLADRLGGRTVRFESKDLTFKDFIYEFVKESNKFYDADITILELFEKFVIQYKMDGNLAYKDDQGDNQRYDVDDVFSDDVLIYYRFFS